MKSNRDVVETFVKNLYRHLAVNPRLNVQEVLSMRVDDAAFDADLREFRRRFLPEGGK